VTPIMALLYAYLALALFIAACCAGAMRHFRSCPDPRHREHIEMLDTVADYLRLEDDNAVAVFLGLAWPILLVRSRGQR